MAINKDKRKYSIVEFKNEGSKLRDLIFATWIWSLNKINKKMIKIDIINQALANSCLKE
ncbi:hypothetical protein MBIO_0062 [Mycoplasmopsis fermentans PG18]|uniref:Uncharacterized protein n=1 Tax=Mycoplasmopsis fermentans (strain ATCC 19989 / NBRC 14854 / NCTC 10117 / PG18) TaxID=496833 RepID=C4XDV5_MYCFP|nr:hypothetical protein MBIO_0062 [Mycoplasmopsis fermentans PG18]